LEIETWKNRAVATNQERVSDAEYHEVEDCEVACEPSEPSLMGRISQIAAHVRRVSAR